MKKNKSLRQAQRQKISPEEALRFLEDIRVMGKEIDEPSVAISVRLPNNILRALKLRAKAEGKKYQSLLIQLLRENLRGR